MRSESAIYASTCTCRIDIAVPTVEVLYVSALGIVSTVP